MAGTTLVVCRLRVIRRVTDRRHVVHLEVESNTDGLFIPLRSWETPSGRLSASQLVDLSNEASDHIIMTIVTTEGTQETLMP